ncbi:group II dsDNA virus coat/capsid protein [Blyttiomyces helicus]|uniref:Group II dsDNA virus coat/capsid protein n=1 Tax=Blyttiomyces helicus TaxID=388810 RepID=A0A4P9WA51_9FUNG|nr:group II dsDNA virus coat/capsid protein [Blyttiomyces helicus]|eukprot:RKO89461.1 group II dsDNA virus coat/capsid protein [Blyttiomyces helicus]
MSSGGLLQLVAYGYQDIYISGSPQKTFFRILYKRHTYFAMESMEQSFKGNADFGRKVTCLVARNGDLIHKAYLEIDLPALTANSGETVAWTRNIGHVLISEISVEIGGAIIDKHYSNWLTIYNELMQVAEKEDGLNVLIGNTAALTTPAATIPAAEIYVPLVFRFNRNPGLALPMIALMYHDVKINISFRPAVECYLYGEESYWNASIVQKLNFSHPTKELIRVIRPDANFVGGVNRWMDFTDNGTGPNLYAGNDPLVDAKIQLNTHDRIITRAAAYFNLLQSYYHHTRCPSTGIYIYSFALEPEKHQASGSINMSRIEGVNLKMTLSTGTSPVRVYLYAVNDNVLRITSGMGGLAYAN